MRCCWALLVCAGLGAAAGGAEVFPRLPDEGENLLANPAFEALAGDALAGWGTWEAGYTPAPGAGRDGSTAAFCRRTDPAEPGQGVAQTITLNQDHPMPLVVTGWSRAEGVDGSPNPDYSIYCDLIYTDGTPLWGQIAPFSTGTHDWQRRRVVIVPLQPVRSITVYGLFRHHLGSAWFDDFSLHQVSEVEGGGPLDGATILAPDATRRGGDQRRAGPLTLTVDGFTVTGVRLGDRDVTGRCQGGFLVRDVAADSGFHDFDPDGSCPALGLALEAEITPRDDHFVVEGRLRDLRGEPRAITLVFGLPVAAGGWRWGRDMRSETIIAGRGELANSASFDAGSNRQLARYPLANIAGPLGALTIAIDMRQPAHYRLSWSGATSLLTIGYDFGLSPLTRNFPSAAPFRFVIYGGDGAWGFRQALADYYRLFPDYFRLRTPQQGIWQAFAATSKVEGWEDFGFRFKEGTDETAWDDAHGLLTFRYCEPGSYWMAMPPDMPRDREHALARLQELAESTNPSQRAFARAVLSSGIRDAQDELRIDFVKAPWCDGALFFMNPNPDLPGDVTAYTLHWNDAAKKAYDQGATPELDGEYLDSLEGFALEDPSPSHLVYAIVPPTFGSDSLQPISHTAFEKFGFVRGFAEWLHARDKLLMANSIPYRFGFLCAWIDVMGTETNWMPGGQYRADDDAIMNLRRALAGKRPYLLLQNTMFQDFGPYVERYFQRSLAYGMLPSMFSHNAASDHYFTIPAWYNRDRELFRKYIPIIKAVAEEGWEPVTGARCDNPAIQLERFGPGPTRTLYLTVHNPTDAPQTGTVSFDETVLGRSIAPRTMTLAPYGTEVLTP